MTLGVTVAWMLQPLLAPANTQLAHSDFDSTCADGWSATNVDGGNETLVCVDDAEDGGKYISARESAGDGKTMVIRASADFLGDKSAAFGGYLQYRLRQVNTDQMSHGGDVRLRGGGLEIVHDYDSIPTADWEWHLVTLAPSGNWRYANTQIPVMEEDFRRVLGQLFDILIRAEFSTRNREVTDLDDFEMVAPEPTSPPRLEISRLPDGRLDVTWPIEYDSYWPEITPAGKPAAWTRVPAEDITGMVDGLWHLRLQQPAESRIVRLRKANSAMR